MPSRWRIGWLGRRIALNNRTARVTAYVATTAMFLWLIGALAVTEVERADPQANITSFNDGLWWAISTMTTVGYGDRYPVTPMGKLIGIALMLTGIAVASVATAAVASWFVEKFQQVEETLSEEIDSSQKAMAALEAKLDQLIAEITALRQEQLIAAGTPHAPTGNLHHKTSTGGTP